MKQKNSIRVEDRISTGAKIGYGVGDFGANLVFQSILIFLIFYFTDVFGIAASVAGTIFFVSKVWDAVTDPTMGYLSDRTHSRWGQKRPYLLFGAIPLGLCFFLLFASPNVSEGFRPIYALIFFLLVCTFYTVVNIPYGALTASMTVDAHERSKISGVRTFFALMGTLTVAGATLPLVDLFGGGKAGFRATGAIFGVMAAILTLVTFFSVRERVTQRDTTHYSLRDIIKVLKNNRPFIILSVGMIMHLTALGVLAAMINYFFKYVMNNADYATFAFLCIFVPAALALPLWVWMSRKVSKKAAFNTGMGLLALALFGIFFVRELNPTVLLPLFIVGGVGLSTNFFSPWAMVPDTVEYGQLQTGLRREGILYGVFFFGQKMASALAGFLAGQGLGLSGFVANEIQTEQALLGIRILTTFVPIALIILGILIISFYPINQAMHTKILTDLEKAQQNG
jgi:GPH family glycoside/pentoside/hexuronide:cation symporter